MTQPIQTEDQFRKVARKVLGISQGPRKAGVQRRIEGLMNKLDRAHPNYQACEELQKFVQRVMARNR